MPLLTLGNRYSIIIVQMEPLLETKTPRSNRHNAIIAISGLALTGSLFGYGVIHAVSHESNTPLTWGDAASMSPEINTNEYFALQPPLSPIETDNSCALNTPYIGEFRPSFVTPENTANEINTFIDKEYGVQVGFVTQMQHVGDFTIAPILYGDVTVSTLATLQETLSHIDARLIDASHIKNFYFARSIIGQSNQEFSGFNTGSDIYLSPQLSKEEMIAVMYHEIWHSIKDQLLCRTDDESDEAFSGLNPIPYSAHNHDIFALAEDSDQAFVSLYAETSLEEDEAETFGHMMTEGPILPGDSNWGSPLQLKEAEILRRLESMTPGFIESLLKRSFTV